MLLLYLFSFIIHLYHYILNQNVQIIDYTYKLNALTKFFKSVDN